MEAEIVEVTLPNGTIALVRATKLDPPGSTQGATKSAFGDRFDFTEVTKVLEGISDAIKSALVKAAPDKTTVELGIEAAVKSGKLTGLLMEGSAKGSLTVTLEWSHAPAS